MSRLDPLINVAYIVLGFVLDRLGDLLIAFIAVARAALLVPNLVDLAPTVAFALAR